MSIKEHIKPAQDHLKESAQSDLRSRVVTYCHLNPGRSVHHLYTQSQQYIPDNLRISFTRLRLSSHRLRIELGRWSNTPRDARLCNCGSVQDEEHILKCVENEGILRNFTYDDAHLGLEQLFSKCKDTKHLNLLQKLMKNIEL